MIAECMRPSVSVAAVALAHSLNGNMLRKWVIDAEHATPPRIAAKTAALAPEVPLPGSTFIQLALTAPAVEGDIRIEVHRAGTTVNVVWPARDEPSDRPSNCSSYPFC